MTRRLRAGTSRRDADGVRITADPAARKQPLVLVAALAVAALAAVALARLLLPTATTRAEPASAGAHAAPATGDAPAAGTPSPRGARVRVARSGAPAPPAGTPARPPSARSTPTAGGADAPAAGEPVAANAAARRDASPTHEEPPFTIGAPGSGIEVFPKPGTDPLRLGLVVPDDFELPEGYVRHFQVTDDGRTLEPILMFHPDYEFFDEDGRPIELPADLVVPPELAPPGLPLRALEPPPPVAQGEELPLPGGAAPPGSEPGEAP
jgi:hypothetical protein